MNTSTENEFGIIYVLTNPAMPGLVKIGKTARDIVDTRLAELYTTGVPVPFECAFAGRVSDLSKVERAFHLAFGPYRINPKREFFEIEPDQAIGLLELMAVENVTPQLQEEAAAVDSAAKDGAERLRSRRPVMNFTELGIPLGSILSYVNGSETCTVSAERKVEYNGEEYSLTALTQKILDLDTAIQPSPHWTYNGSRLIDIYNEVHGDF